MEPIKFTLELSLSDNTLTKLKDMVDVFAASFIASAQPEACKSLLSALQEEPDKNAGKAPEAPAQAPAPAAVEIEDMPEEICDPAPAKPVEVRDLFDAVKRAQTERKVTPASIRKLYADLSEKWGVEFTSTRDCPEQCRAELLEAINNLGK